ncbi:hypothetical protein L873DRAFT_1848154 [Choiromyces venosus 120613-1]|uniref:Uncharacterized protein n=1 Tax=Choiromyces venosus 120613-1 TaxID=1336337 RepID=A0A3N4J332_9PEZI|nr:hypothetical protein L873DRAFT_1848154 [Choiromyces venosus 120613-1]
MPQGLTYWDMARMLKAQIPAGFYKLELNEQFIRKGKMVGREILEPYLQEEFYFQLQMMIETWGKAMGLSINGGFWLRWQFALHSLAPCPIMDITTFKENPLHSQNQQALRHQRKSNAIYFEIAGSKNNCLWNGIGISHAVEILYLALIHPEEKIYNVFRSQELKERLVEAIEDFFVQAHSLNYQQRILANKTPTRAFEFTKSTT